MNRLRVNAQIFFCVGTFIESLFYHFRRQMISNSIYFDRYGLKSVELWGKLALCSVGKHESKKEITFRTKFWGGGDAETYLHGTTLSDFTIVCS